MIRYDKARACYNASRCASVDGVEAGGAVRLGEIASRLGLPVEGDPGLEITGLAGLEDAGPTELSFVTGPRYSKVYEACRGGAFGIRHHPQPGQCR